MIVARSIDEATYAARRYLVRVLVITAALFGMLCAFNILIDPLGLLRIATIAGVNNDRRPALEAGHRNIREIEIFRRRPDTLILGSSRELYGIQPTDIALRRGGHVHNASIAAATIADFEGLMTGAGAIVGVRRIYIGLDYFSFDDRRVPALPVTADIVPIATRSARQFLRSIVTIPALIQSLETIKASFCRPEGEEFPTDGRRVLDISLTPCGRPHQPISTPEIAAGVATLFSFDSRTATMAAFERVLRRCVEVVLDCRPFIGPMHGVYLIALHETDWTRYQSWKAELADIAIRNDIDLLDMSSALSASALPLAQAPDRFYDSLHYGSQIGAEILDLLDAAAESPHRLTTDAERLAALRTRDEAMIMAFKGNDPTFAAALTQAIRTRSDVKRRE